MATLGVGEPPCPISAANNDSPRTLVAARVGTEIKKKNRSREVYREKVLRFGRKGPKIGENTKFGLVFQRLSFFVLNHYNSSVFNHPQDRVGAKVEPVEPFAPPSALARGTVQPCLLVGLCDLRQRPKMSGYQNGAVVRIRLKRFL